MENKLDLVIPNSSHKEMYIKMITRWEATGEKIEPQLLSRYSGRFNKNVSYEKWLAWCEDDRTTGSNLADHVPCTLYFMIQNDEEIVGSIEINHGSTHRGHLHAGIVPWHRGKGYGTHMLELALIKCREMGYEKAQIVPHKENTGAIRTILNNGGVLIEEFCEDGIWSHRYEIGL